MNCKVCGNEIPPKTGKGRKPRYCSAECVRENNRRRVAEGRRNGRYKEQIKGRKFHREGDKCEKHGCTLVCWGKRMRRWICPQCNAEWRREKYKTCPDYRLKNTLRSNAKSWFRRYGLVLRFCYGIPPVDFDTWKHRCVKEKNYRWDVWRVLKKWHSVGVYIRHPNKLDGRRRRAMRASERLSDPLKNGLRFSTWLRRREESAWKWRNDAQYRERSTSQARQRRERMKEEFIFSQSKKPGAKGYKIKRGDFALLAADAAGCCHICHDPRELDIDHCHATGVVRGLLCATCNTLLGRTLESKKVCDIYAWLGKAKAYLADPPASRVLNTSTHQNT